MCPNICINSVFFTSETVVAESVVMIKKLLQLKVDYLDFFRCTFWFKMSRFILHKGIFCWALPCYFVEKERVW